MDTAATVQWLIAESAIRPVIAVYVSYASFEARWIECPCHPPFAAFIKDELFPWLEKVHPEVRTCKERVLVGLSYTGLAASYVALQTEHLFTAVISQSGSYWSNDRELTRRFALLSAPLPVRFHLDVGTGETQENVRHKEDVLQVKSQLDAVREFHEVLVNTGHEVDYQEFEGAHDFACWKQTLPAALRWALPPTPQP